MYKQSFSHEGLSLRPNNRYPLYVTYGHRNYGKVLIVYLQNSVVKQKYLCVKTQRNERGPTLTLDERRRIMRKRSSRKRIKPHRIKRRSLNKLLRGPRTAEELFARSRKFQDQWNRVVQIPSEMRAHGLSLSQAARQFGLSAKTVLRLAPSAFRKSGNQYKVKSSDRLLRVMQIPSKRGLRELVLKDSREASFVGEYWSAIEKFLVHGDSSALGKLRRRAVKDATGKRVRLLFNLDEIKRQGSMGVLRFEAIYGRSA